MAAHIKAVSTAGQTVTGHVMSVSSSFNEPVTVFNWHTRICRCVHIYVCTHTLRYEKIGVFEYVEE